ALVATFLLYPARQASRDRVTGFDWALSVLAVASLSCPLVDFARIVYRAATPNSIDLILGPLLVFVILEATRRTVGWVLPFTALVFVAYAYYGPLLDFIGLSLIGHRGYQLDRIIGTLYLTLEGIFGVPLD